MIDRPLPTLQAWSDAFHGAEVPVLREIAPGHLSACHLNDR